MYPDPAHVPGYTPALNAVQRVGGILLELEAAQAFTLVALSVATPHIKAEVLADLADDVLDLARLTEASDARSMLETLSRHFDQSSHTVRKALPR